MDLNSKLKLHCPNCNIKIEQRVQRKMNKFWRGLQITECEGCGENIQWHHSLHAKFKIGGFIFKVGVLLMFLAFITLVFNIGENSSWIFLASLTLIMIGGFSTYTPNDKVKVELVQKT